MLRPPLSPALRAWPWVALAAAGLLAGCTSYEPDPVDPLDVLRELQSLDPAGLRPAEVAPVVTSFDAADGLSLLEASAVALRRNPALAALRAELGVAEARLDQAGLPADPVIGWSAGDPFADALVEGKVGSTSWLSGASLSWQVPRPGELDAQEGVARAGIQAAAARLARAEWSLVREVHLAYAGLLVARASLAQRERLAGIAQRSLDYFSRARGAGAATALQEGLARVAADTVRADVVGARGAEVQARQALNARLGLPPELGWELQDALDRFDLPPAPPQEDPGQLVRDALGRRPDLRLALADYQRAEEQLRLECARQWPRLEIGTGIALQLPIFSQLNQPAIQTATRARAAARRRVTVAVQQARAEIHAALALRAQAYAALALFQGSLARETEETLRLTQRALQAREVTPLEILTAQRQVLDVQARSLVSRRAWAEACIRLDSACGRLLPATRPAPLTASETHEQESP